MTGSDTLQAIELFVAVLAVAGLVAIAARPLRLPHTVALVAVGLVIGGLAGPIRLEGGLRVTPELVLLVLLPGLVFEAAYRIRLADLRRWFSGLLILAVPGVLISAGVVGLVLYLATGLRPDLAFLVGAMVSATDPAAVVATFKRIAVSRSIATLVDGESLLNDGTGLVLFAIAVRAVSEPVGPLDAVLSFAAATVISTIIGLAAGFLAARLLAGVHDHLIELTISVVLAYGTYLVADQLHFSGVLATVTAAVVFGYYGPGGIGRQGARTRSTRCGSSWPTCSPRSSSCSSAWPSPRHDCWDRWYRSCGRSSACSSGAP
jgi:monovalent cation:H+ antiporter, CPA1 family